VTAGAPDTEKTFIFSRQPQHERQIMPNRSKLMTPKLQQLALYPYFNIVPH
jgi:lipocalin